MANDKFQNKYRISSARLQSWDYASDGAYFITICTKERMNYFGEIEKGKMKFSPIGAIADVLWCEIENHAKNVELGHFVVMPNHVHGIILLNGNGSGTNGAYDLNHTNDVETRQPPLRTIGIQRFQNQGKNSVSSIIGGYKSAVTKHANRLGFEFGWQSRFYDHIIRDAQSFENISHYIVNNPDNWEKDKFCG
ncbi:MAG TPA: transposase [Daejeonella sp.]|nr:transposase [Daejeonella sp.]